MIYLEKPLSPRKSQHLIKFLTIICNLELISESAFADTANHFDDYVWYYMVGIVRHSKR
jgi:hypothetical protein